MTYGRRRMLADDGPDALEKGFTDLSYAAADDDLFRIKGMQQRDQGIAQVSSGLIEDGPAFSARFPCS